MPRRRRCWASWVYTSDGEFLHPKITVTYWMNLLQGIDIPQEFIFDQTDFDHPVFDQAAIAAQGQIGALQGRHGTWFAGAHLGHGFHEDGCASAVKVARGLGAPIPWEPARELGAAQQKSRPCVVLPDFPATTPVPAELF